MSDVSQNQPVPPRKKITLFKRIIRYLTIWDGIWSVPVAVFLFIAAGNGIVAEFGPEAGSMLPVYLQRLLYAAICMVIANFIALFILYMNFRDVFKYYLLKSGKDFDDLPGKTKIIFILILYFAYIFFFATFLILV